MFGKKVLKCISIFSLAAIVLTVSVFCCYNRPKQVKAEVISATILGLTALLSFLAAQGVSLSLEGMSTDEMSSEVNSMLSGYNAGGKTWDDFNDNSSNWATALIGKDNVTRYVCLGYEFLDWASGLPDWLKTTFGLQINTPTTIFSNNMLETLDGAVPVLVNPSTPSYSFYELASPVTDKNVGDHIIRITNDYYLNFRIDSTATGYQNSFLNATFLSSVDGGSTWITHPTTSFNNNGRYTNFQIVVRSHLNNLYFGAYNPQLASNPQGQWNDYLYQTGIPISALTISNFSLEGTLTDGYQDLQDALDQDLQEQENNPDAVGVIDVGNVGGLTTEQIYERIIERISAGDIDIDGVGVDVYEDVPAAEQEKDAEESTSTGEITGDIVIVDGLEDFFPFCIPFDFIALLGKFNAEPEAPKFNVEIGFGGVFEEEEIEIDLSPFETAAEIFRILMIIGFAIFLILKTRDLIRG